MRLKVLLLALVFAVSCFAFLAQPAKAEGPSVTPFADVIWWTGFTKYDKDSSQSGEAKTDFAFDVAPQTTLGVRGSVNGVFVNVAYMARTPVFGGKYTYTDVDDTGAVNVKYINTPDAKQTSLFLAFMSYKFGEVGLTIGQTFTRYSGLDFSDPAFEGGTGLAWDLMFQFGMFDPARPLIEFSYMGAYVALVQNYQNEEMGGEGKPFFNMSDPVGTKNEYPMLSVGYLYGNPGTPMSLGVHGIYGQYAIDQADSAIDGETISTYGISVNFGMNMGALALSAHGQYGVNLGNQNITGGGNYLIDVDSVSDTTGMAGRVGVSYTIGAIKVAGGLGYSQVDNDLYENADPRMQYYVSLRYNIQPNFAVTPVIQINDKMKDMNKEKEGKVTTFGFMAEAHI